MPSNPNKEIRIVRALIDTTLKKIEVGREINYNLLLRHILINHAVSERAVIDFINNYYIDTGEFCLEQDGTLYRNGVKVDAVQH